MSSSTDPAASSKPATAPAASCDGAGAARVNVRRATGVRFARSMSSAVTLMRDTPGAAAASWYISTTAADDMQVLRREAERHDVTLDGGRAFGWAQRQARQHFGAAFHLQAQLDGYAEEDALDDAAGGVEGQGGGVGADAQRLGSQQQGQPSARCALRQAGATKPRDRGHAIGLDGPVEQVRTRR